MSDRDTQTAPSARTQSAWDLVSDLADDTSRSWTDVADTLVQRLVESGLARSAGVWLVDGNSPEVRLQAQREFLRLPWLTIPELKPDHEQWLSSVFVRGQPLTWSPPPQAAPHGDEGWPTLFAARTGRTPVGVAVLEVMPNGSGDHFEPDAFGDLLTELAATLERRMQGPPPPPRIPDVPMTPPIGAVGSNLPTASPPPVTVSAEAVAQALAAMAAKAAPQAIPAAAPTEAGAAHEVAWEKLVQLALNLQKSLSVKEVSAIGANDGRVWLGCDRVTVLSGRRPKVAAVSGLTRLSRRSPWVRTVERLAQVAVKGGIPLSFPAEDVELPEAVEKPLGDYLAEGHSRLLRLVPLKVAEPSPETEEPDLKRRRPALVVGCLLVEQLTEGDVSSDWEWRADQLARCVARPLANAQSFESVFLLPLWRAIGGFWRSLRGSRLWTLLAIVVGLALVTAAMVLIPWEYRVEAEGLLLPADKREVFVPMDAEVREVFVTSGQHVAAGDVLVRLENPELEAELVAATTQLDEKRKLHRALQFQIDQALRAGRREEELRLFGQMEEAREQILGLSRQVAILTERAARLEVRSPVDGTVATFQVDQLLRHRPVQRGEVLLSIMNEEGPWQLELQVEESRLGHLVRAQQQGGEALPVEFVLVTKPERHYQATLQEVATRATLNEEQQLVVRSIADLQVDLGDQRRIGAEVRARIGCGPKPLGYVLFGDVIEFLQRYFWW
uniref:HlyD family efflux transporter periplasmic adaptor subunit n=1 Tax=Schlesneria paludicola TaxID=360056 RepID=A0A7C2K313_9PLAN